MSVASGERAVELLVAAGAEVRDRRREDRTVLDSFDGRLLRAGVVAERITSAGERWLTLRAVGAVDPIGRVPASSGTLRTTAVRPGLVRERLDAVLAPRAATPLARSRRDVVELLVRDGGAAAARLVVEHPPRQRDGTALVRVEELPGHAGAAARAVDALAELDPEPAADPALAALERAGIDPDGQDTSLAVPMSGDDPIGLTVAHLLARADHVVALVEPGVTDDVDVEFVHDLRVALRRARSVLQLVPGALPEGDAAALLDAIKDYAAATGPLRDVDVLLLRLDERDDARLEPVRRVLLAERERALGQVRDVIEDADDVHDLLHRVVTAATDGTVGPGGRERTSTAATAAIRRAAKRMRKRAERLDTPEDVHQLRKDAKRLRYLLECFAPLFPRRRRKAVIRDMKAVQDLLGAHQDAVVHAAHLRAVRDRLDPQDEASIAALDELVTEITDEEARTGRAARRRAHELRSTEARAHLAELIERVR